MSDSTGPLFGMMGPAGRYATGADAGEAARVLLFGLVAAPGSRWRMVAEQGGKGVRGHGCWLLVWDVTTTRYPERFQI